MKYQAKILIWYRYTFSWCINVWMHLHTFYQKCQLALIYTVCYNYVHAIGSSGVLECWPLNNLKPFCMTISFATNCGNWLICRIDLDKLFKVKELGKICIYWFIIINSFCRSMYICLYFSREKTFSVHLVPDHICHCVNYFLGAENRASYLKTPLISATTWPKNRTVTPNLCSMSLYTPRSLGFNSINNTRGYQYKMFARQWSYETSEWNHTMS